LCDGDHLFMVKAARVRDLRDVNLEDYHQEARENAMPMKNPPHPGDFIRTEIVEPAGLSVTAAAAALGVSRPALSLSLIHICNSSGDEGGGGVVAEADSGGDSGGDGDHVLEGSAEFDADDVGGGVEAEGCRRELVLNAGGDFRVGKGYGDGGGLGLSHLKGEAGTGEGADGEMQVGIGTRRRRDSRRAYFQA